MTGQSMTYNDLDLIGNIVRNDTTLVNYSYLSDGTKLSALDGSGEGLVYRGPFVYRKSSGGNAGSSLTLESAAFGARQYSPALRRWMTPDPLSEKYYGTSPYAFCNNNPVNFVDPDGRMPILVLPAIPFIVEGLKDLFFVATAAWAVYKTHEYVQEKSKYNSEYGDQQRRGNRAKGELDRAQLNIQESIERNFNKDNLNGGPHLDPNRKGEAALITFLYLVYNTAINPNTNMPYDYVVKFLTGNTDENNNDDSSSNMNGQPTILPAKTDSNSEDSDSESGDEIKDPFEYYRLKFHLYDIE